jgi:hypothetical protein
MYSGATGTVLIVYVMCAGELGGAVPLAVQQLCEPGLPLPHVRGAQDGEGIHRLHTTHGNVFILALQVQYTKALSLQIHS